VEAVLDISAVDNWVDLADSLSDHLRHVWLSLSAGHQKTCALVGRFTFCHQPCVELDLHTDSICHAELATGGSRHLDRLGYHRVDDSSGPEALPLVRRRSDALFRVSIDSGRIAVVDHMDESMIVERRLASQRATTD
jgi:hypothetical protein